MATLRIPPENAHQGVSLKSATRGIPVIASTIARLRAKPMKCTTRDIGAKPTRLVRDELMAPWKVMARPLAAAIISGKKSLIDFMVTPQLSEMLYLVLSFSGDNIK
jgi:hypothetical protein